MGDLTHSIPKPLVKVNGKPIISEKIEDEIKNNRNFNNLYWDNVVLKSLKNLNFKIRRLKEYDFFEIDTAIELEELEKYLTERDNNE